MWFSSDAIARFSGCESQVIAEKFTNNALRVGAFALGTAKIIGTGMESGAPMMYERRLGPIIGVYSDFSKSSEYFSSALWIRYPGKL